VTFSIVARSDDGESWGIAIASKFLAIGAASPAAVAGVGAISTQADVNVAHKFVALAHLDDGATAQVALDRLLDDDPSPESRQVGIVDSDGSAATHTGDFCFPWAGGTTGRTGERGGYAVQGNLLTGPEVVDAMERAWLEGGHLTFEHRLLTALVAGDEAGGDRRGRQSAALLVVREDAGLGGHDDTAVDLRVDDHTSPVAELTRLLDVHDLHRVPSSPEEQVPVDDTLLSALQARAHADGHEHIAEWVAHQDLTLRVAPGLRPAWIDRRVADLLHPPGDTPST
jgi:uncharacterized Ntn-hydrolase superfamily protein